MAFKILNDQELSLLSDNERIEYEKQQDLYQKRIALAERLEELESTQLQPYEPLLHSIFYIDKLDIKSYKKTEYVMQKIEPVEKPKLQVRPFQKPEQSAPVLPLMPKQADVRTGSIQKLEVRKTDLPMVTKPQAVLTEYKKPDVRSADLPQITDPTIRAVRTNISAVTKISRSDLPEIKMASAEMLVFQKPEIEDMNLPEVKVLLAECIDFRRPEISSLDLPDIKIASVKTAIFQKPEISDKNLPEVKVSPAKTAVFHKPGISTMDLPEVKVSPVKTTVFQKPEISDVNLAEVEVSPVRTVIFQKPGMGDMNLPEVKVSPVKTALFRRPEANGKSLPEVKIIPVEIAAFRSREIQSTEFAPAVVPHIYIDRHKPVNTFQPVMSKAHKVAYTAAVPSAPTRTITMKRSAVTSLPSVHIQKIPDAYAALRELLPASGED